MCVHKLTIWILYINKYLCVKITCIAKCCVKHLNVIIAQHFLFSLNFSYFGFFSLFLLNGQALESPQLTCLELSLLCWDPKHCRGAAQLQNCRAFLSRSQAAFQGNSAQLEGEFNLQLDAETSKEPPGAAGLMYVSLQGELLLLNVLEILLLSKC